MPSEGKVDPSPKSFDKEMNSAEQVLNNNSSPPEWISDLKGLLIDDYIYSEVLEGQNSSVVEPLKVDLIGRDHSDEEIRQAVNSDIDPEAVVKTVNSYVFDEKQYVRRQREELTDPDQGELLDFEEVVNATKESLVWDSKNHPEDSPVSPYVASRYVNAKMKDAVVESATSDEDLPSDVGASDAPLSDNEVLEAIDDELIRNDEEMLEAIKEGAPYSNGDFYERALQLGVDLHKKTEKEAFSESVFDDIIEASDGLGIDYVLRGGKRLRPAMTLLTEYGLEGEISHKGLLIGAAQEVIHGSSLALDDEMDGDEIRRNKLSTERLNRALFEEKSYDQSILDGNKVMAWAGKPVLAAVGEGVPQETAQKAFTIEADLQDGQKRDIKMENADLGDTDLEDYENMIEGKTGALYRGGVEMMVETHLENEDYSRRDQCSLENKNVHGLFTKYMDSFNKLFQAGDDMIEIFNSDDVEKSTSDIKNRKITFPALNTKYGLENMDNDYAGIFLDMFDRNYDEIANQNGEISSEVRQTASGMDKDDSEIDLEIPSEAQVGGDWEDQWITNVIREYGRDPSKEKAHEYIQNAKDAINTLEGNNVLDDEIADKYKEMAEFVYNRDT
ncbi:hypothetical protein GLU64_02430 [Nanohaloarchaea archaeon]|nr:hypothetical protein [Candidatus Nanohaloarchaea archaeon]